VRRRGGAAGEAERLSRAVDRALRNADGAARRAAAGRAVRAGPGKWERQAAACSARLDAMLAGLVERARSEEGPAPGGAPGTVLSGKVRENGKRDKQNKKEGA